MIDGLVIVFSAGMCLLLAFRALRLDAVLPWFGAEAGDETRHGPGDAAAAGRPGGWRDRANTGSRR